MDEELDEDGSVEELDDVMNVEEELSGDVSGELKLPPAKERSPEKIDKARALGFEVAQQPVSTTGDPTALPLASNMGEDQMASMQRTI